MREIIYQANLDDTLTLLNHCLSNQASSDVLSWLKNKQTQIFKEKSDSLYFMTFSAISSYFNKDILSLTKNELNQANAIRKHWHLGNWSVAQAARAYLVLSFARYRLEHFEETINKLFGAADLHELIALYQTLPLCPYPHRLLLHATNGIRSNMVSVFEAIALNNPYPEDFFDEIAWNQLVLKALFVDSPIRQVVGLKRRANPTLAKALINTVQERSSANRAIKPEVWCLIGISIDKENWPLLKALTTSDSAVIQQGALLACNHCPLPEAQALLNKSDERHETMQNDLNKLTNFEQELI
ncbi:Uncharacterised protein [Legionella beliardensis]|uniref:HEAT repeat domain-containing protein n=1 Tax=Legionella beliardensis TaxID=91822 RepID=A0A378IBQ6_9GAMM|nr:EboA domain-containing protein [Legionella beliardensis]STX29724.1 Uncharacterised protein [Legionella beliardensis]